MTDEAHQPHRLPTAVERLANMVADLAHEVDWSTKSIRARRVRDEALALVRELQKPTQRENGA